MAQVKKTVKINKYNSILNGENNGFSIVDGEIYEYYCYEKIINEHQDITFIKLEENKKNKNGFWISSDRNLYYQSDGIDLGEFDIVGFDKNGILNWWEITKQKTNFKFVIDKIERKKELMSKLFDKFNFYLIVPEANEHLHKYKEKIEIIEEPDYTKLRKPEYNFVFENDNFCELCFLTEKAKKYNFIEELIKLSREHFKSADTRFKSNLFERLYDINNIMKGNFQFYDVEKQKLGRIIIKGISVLKNGKEVKSYKATYKEIIQIRKRIKS